jgi:hypothetical protein
VSVNGIKSGILKMSDPFHYIENVLQTGCVDWSAIATECNRLYGTDFDANQCKSAYLTWFVAHDSLGTARINVSDTDDCSCAKTVNAD